jgi:hypothetical protein
MNILTWYSIFYHNADLSILALSVMTISTIFKLNFFTAILNRSHSCNIQSNGEEYIGTVPRTHDRTSCNNNFSNCSCYKLGPTIYKRYEDTFPLSCNTEAFSRTHLEALIKNVWPSTTFWYNVSLALIKTIPCLTMFIGACHYVLSRVR